jgi:hypothetical protein
LSEQAQVHHAARRRGGVAAFEKASFAQALTKRCDLRCVSLCRCRSKEPDHRHRSLLRARRERPCSSRSAEQRDEDAAFHSITAVYPGSLLNNCCATRIISSFR